MTANASERLFLDVCPMETNRPSEHIQPVTGLWVNQAVEAKAVRMTLSENCEGGASAGHHA